MARGVNEMSTSKEKFTPIVIGGLQINYPDEETRVPVAELDVQEMLAMFPKALEQGFAQHNDKVIAYKIDEDTQRYFLKVKKLGETVKPLLTIQRWAVIAKNFQPFELELKSDVHIPRNTIITVVETPLENWAEFGITAEQAFKLIREFLDDPWDNKNYRIP